MRSAFILNHLLQISDSTNQAKGFAAVGTSAGIARLLVCLGSEHAHMLSNKMVTLGISAWWLSGSAC